MFKEIAHIIPLQKHYDLFGKLESIINKYKNNNNYFNNNINKLLFNLNNIYNGECIGLDIHKCIELENNNIPLFTIDYDYNIVIIPEECYNFLDDKYKFDNNYISMLNKLECHNIINGEKVPNYKNYIKEISNIDFKNIGILNNNYINNTNIDIKIIYWYSHWKESLNRWKTIYYNKIVFIEIISKNK